MLPDMQRVEATFPTLSQASRLILVDLLIHGPASRADLARRAGLSPASLTRITKSLFDADLVTNSDAASPQRTGRPSQPMDVNTDLAHLVGVKLSADQLNLVTTDLRAALLSERTVPLTVSDPAVVISTIVEGVEQAVRVDPRIGAIGISLAGPVSSRAETVHISPFLGWSEVPLGAGVRDRTGLPTVVVNDVRAFTAAEHWFGAAAGISNFALVTIGTGVGCGLVVDDRLVEGGTGGSGQIGHLPITEWGPLCERGHRGCVRGYLSSGSVAAQMSAILGRAVGYDEVLALAAAGDPAALRLVEEAGRALGTVIGIIASVMAPEVVLISGEGAGLADLAMDTVRHYARVTEHWTLPDIPIKIVDFSFTEWARGAAVIALRHLLDAAVRPEA